MPVRGFSSPLRGSFAGDHLPFLLTPCPQDSRGRKAPAVPVLGQHLLVIAWININGCHGRGCLLWLPGRGTWGLGGRGKQGRSGKKRPVNAMVTVHRESRGAGKELLGLGLAFSCYRRQRPQTLESPGAVGCSSPPKAKKPAPPSPSSPPRAHASPWWQINSRYGGKMGGEDSGRLGRNNSGARPPLLGKESRRGAQAGGSAPQAERSRPSGGNNARGGWRRGRGGPGEGETGKAGPRVRPPFRLLLLLAGGGGLARGCPPPGCASRRGQSAEGEEECAGKLRLGEGRGFRGSSSWQLCRVPLVAGASMQQVPGALPV